ncbi:MAG: hypothetical protein AAF517_13400 [Planctomycetota bacterium]
MFQNQRSPLRFTVAALVVSSLAWGLVELDAGSPQEKSGATRIAPKRAQLGQSVKLARGEYNLSIVLQKFATSNDELVYLAPGIPPDFLLKVDRGLESLSFTKLEPLLKEASLEASRETYRGEDVIWVRKILTKPKKRGGLRYRGKDGEKKPRLRTSKKSGSPVEAGKVTRKVERVEAAGSGTKIFERVDGDESVFLVTFEAETKEEAELVARTVSLILKDRRAKSD